MYLNYGDIIVTKDKIFDRLNSCLCLIEVYEPDNYFQKNFNINRGFDGRNNMIRERKKIDKKDYCAGIVTYNSDIKKLMNNINAVSEQINCIYIVDNGSNNRFEIKKTLEQVEKVILISNKKNEGIAKALNQIFRKAKEYGYEWVLTLDQDSVCAEGMVERLAGYVGEDVGVVCPNLTILGWNVEVSELSDDECVVEVDNCITSGALTNVAAWEAVGGFNEDYFIDMVDFEFCRKLRNQSYRIVRVMDCYMEHEIGESKELHILGRVKHFSKHSPIRCYYMTRNRLKYIHDFRDSINYKFEKKMLYYDIISNMIAADNKIEVVKKIIRGIKDYKNGTSGKFSDN